MNLPNRLSILRIVLVPLMVVLFVLPIPYGKLWATAVFCIAAFTDFLDGYLARKYHLVTDLGKLLDPIADKLLNAAALILVAEAQILPVGIGAAVAIVIIGREFLISALRQIAASKNKIIQANVYGKNKTITQDIALPLLMIQSVFDGIVYDVLRYASYVMLGIAIVMTIVSCVIYLVQNKSVFQQE